MRVDEGVVMRVYKSFVLRLRRSYYSVVGEKTVVTHLQMILADLALVGGQLLGELVG